MKKNNPILITSPERSGSEFIAHILEICGAETGLLGKMYENLALSSITNLISNVRFDSDTKLEGFDMFADLVTTSLKKQQINGLKWLFKNARLSHTWKYWHKLYPNAQWVIVRRKPSYIINSCMKTTYMNIMKNPITLKLIGVKTEQEGWLWLIHQYEKQWIKMYKTGLNIIEVYPDRMGNNDYSQIQALVEKVGLEWNIKVEKMMCQYFTEKWDKIET